MDEPDFKIFFNKKRQWINIYLDDVHPKTFSKKGGGNWGFFIAKWSNPKLGHFGDVHLVKSRVREDLIVHEFFHVFAEWIWSNRTSITSQNEERMAEFMDELVRKFYREYRKLK